MKVFVIFASIVGACLAIPVDASNLIKKCINNPGYFEYERKDGLFKAEALYDARYEPRMFFPSNTVSRDDVTFYFFNHKNRQGGVKIKESQLHDVVKLTGFNIKEETLVIIHGWLDKRTSPISDLIKTAALKKRNINVIVVDWNPISGKCYVTAKLSVLAVGNYVGDFLLKLQKELKYRLQKVTIVGHSLGAHISGNAGARTKGLINTIIGLDPAGPLFSKRNINNRLDPTDAFNVQVIHTNDGLLGFDIKMGYADFYPNGGRKQPGCGLDLLGICSHNRAFQIYAESLNNNNFKSRICWSWFDYQRNKCNRKAANNLGGFPVKRS